MLIEFKVTNFRSINDTQTLSMVAGSKAELKEKNTFTSGIPALPDILRSAVIYGPNAAGKSNLLHALWFMDRFVATSQSMQEGEDIKWVVPFLLNKEGRNTPSEFEVIFVQDNIRYQYGFSANNVRVMREWLIAYPENRPQRWFERGYDEKNNEYNWYFGSKFAGSHSLRDTWQKATRQNALFLSTAIQLNNEQLKPVFNWFQQKLAVVPPEKRLDLTFTIKYLSSMENKDQVMKFLSSADLGITDIEVKKIPITPDALPSDMTQEMKDKIINDLQGKEGTVVKFLHKSADDSAPMAFDISYESDGTRKLFGMAGPLLTVLKNGSMLFVDELDSSLHPLMVRYIIGLIHDPEVNKNNAQLVFTTHDTSVLDNEIFRRDQVWFMEKDKESASRLYPLSDFSPRKGEALEKGYLKGRYGALPFIGEFKF